MKIPFNYFKYFLLLTIFNAFLSLSNKDNYELQETICDYNISDNYIKTIKLTKGQNITLNVSYTYGKDLFLSIKTLDDKSFNLLCDDIEIVNINDTKEFKSKIDKVYFHENQLFIIEISSKEANTIEIINIVDEDKNKYSLIKKKNNTYTISDYNFVYFIESNKIENDTKVLVKFKDKIQASLYYSLIKLSSKDADFIPRVFNFDKTMYSKEENFNDKEKTIEFNADNKTKGIENCNNIAFIFSIKPVSNVNEYNVTINEEIKDDIMNEFLIGSIVLALIFAVITFFLIRRKKNINEKKTEEDFYKEENKEEDEKN